MRGHRNEIVRGTVEDALNAMLDAEADELCNAQRYEHSPVWFELQENHKLLEVAANAP